MNVRSADRLELLSLYPVDFTKSFHWNTKQLFLYTVLEYESEKYVQLFTCLIPRFPL